jgi:hypothetical protein
MEQSQTAKKIFQRYNNYLDDTREWREQRDKLEQNYHGALFTPSEGKDKQDSHETALVDNRLRPLLRKRTSKLIANSPTGTLYGVSDDDQGAILDVLSALGDHFWDISGGKFQATRAIHSMTKLGPGYWIVYNDPLADYGMGELKFKAISYKNVFYDKAAEDMWESPYVIVRRLMDLDKFVERFPKFKEEKSNLIFVDDTVRYKLEREDRSTIDTELPEVFEGNEEKQFVLYLEQYEKVIKPVYIFRQLAVDGQLQIFELAVGEKEEALMQRVLTPDMRAQLESGLAIWYSGNIPRIKVTTTINDKYEVVKPYELPIENYPIIEIRNEDTANGEARGEMDYMVANQEFMSKALNIVIGNAAMGSFLRYVADPTKLTEFMKQEEFKKAVTEPGGILWMMQDSMTGKFPLDTLRPEPLNEAYVYLMNYMAYSMEYSMQQFGSTMGDTSNAPRTFSATAQYGEWADEALVMPRDEVERGIQRLYDIFFQWAPHYYSAYKQFSTFDDDTEEKSDYELNKPAPQPNGGLLLLNNISNFRARFRIRKGSTAPSMSVMKANLYKDLLQVTQNPAFLLPMLEYLPTGKYKAQLKETLNQLPQMQQQLEQASQQIDQLSAELTRQTQQNVELSKRINIEKTTQKVDKEATKTIFELRDLVRQVKREVEALKTKDSSDNKE